MRHFHNKKIVIDHSVPAEKEKLIKTCELMGAKICSEPCDYCLLITNKTNTERVAKAKKCRNVKIIKPMFVTDCQKVGAYLDEKEYFHKLWLW